MSDFNLLLAFTPYGNIYIRAERCWIATRAEESDSGWTFETIDTYRGYARML